MSQQILNPETEIKDPVQQKLFSQINEEKLVKDSTSQLGKIKSLEELADEIRKAPHAKQLRAILEENLKESTDSVVSRFVLGLLDFKLDKNVIHLKSLLEEFQKNAKWTVVDHIADLILKMDDSNRLALRAKVESTERLRGKKELKPYLAKLVDIERNNPDILRKYSMSIIEEDAPKALSLLKKAAEIYASQKEYARLEEIWNLIVEKDPKDLGFFEKIERTLAGNREKTRIAAYLAGLVEVYRKEENYPTIITLLKKILDYEPASVKARSDLIRAYKARYESHSLLNEFLKMSDLSNNKKPVGPCIASFERNIVFDNENYVHHRTRGVGKITSIDKDFVIIDFHNNPGQKMSIQMAISSVQPLSPQHIWVRFYENPEEVKEIFSTDPGLFIEMMLTSFNGKMTLADVKTEVVGKFITLPEWSKWWASAREIIKGSDRFGFSPKKKDEVLLRETPITQGEELAMKFQSLNDWDKKLDVAMKALSEIEAEEGVRAGVQFYQSQEENKDLLKKVHSYLYLQSAAKKYSAEEIPRHWKEDDILGIFKALTKEQILKLFRDTHVIEFKKEIVNLVIKSRTESTQILLEMLFDLPINKHHNHIIDSLETSNQTDALSQFIQKAFNRYRENAETFLWISKNILKGDWQKDWAQVLPHEAMLQIFRLLKPLGQIEKKGTTLKNDALRAIFGTTNITIETVRKSPIADILQQVESKAARRMAALFKEVPYIPDAHKENFLSLIEEMHPGYASAEETSEEQEEPLFPSEDVILVSPEGLQKRKSHLDHLINVELPANSKDIGEAQEKGDLRENAEYKAAMERQHQLQAEITRVDAELKKARLIEGASVRTDLVSIGSKVTVKTSDESKVYLILGPWEADADKNVISYVSPLGRSLIGKKVGETASFSDQKFIVEKIEKGL